MHYAHEVERRVLRAAEADRVDVLGHADHRGCRALEGQGFAEGVFLRPESASQTSRHHDGRAIRLLKLAAAKDGYAEGFEETGRAVVDIDCLDGVGARGRAGFHGDAADHRQLIGSEESTSELQSPCKLV